MIDLPVRFPRDPWCRAGTRLMLTLDGETGACFLGLTPDGVQPGRDMLARLSLWRGGESLPYRAEQSDGAIVLEAEGGFVRLRLGCPENLQIEGEGVSLLIGKGRALGMFMSGGSAVDDPLPGALYVNAGARMRIVPKRGETEVRSAWNLNALSDPDPRVFLHPDGTGALEAAVYVTDFDAPPAEAAAPEPGAEFEDFLSALRSAPSDGEGRHAAYILWSCRQNARALADPQLTGPVYVSNRRTLGSAFLSDNVLLAALLGDAQEAARQMCAFLPYLDENGLPPRIADNRGRVYEAETPWFGAVLSARPDILDCLGESDYNALSRALAWWRRERFDPERRRFFYRHRYEPGLGKGVKPEDLESLSPLLNACMGLWLAAMARLAERLGRPEEAEACRAAAQDLPDALPAIEPVPAALELPLLLAGDAKARRETARRVLARGGEFSSLRQALTYLAADAEGGK